MKDIKDKLRRATLIGMAIMMTATSTACSMESDNIDKDQEVTLIENIEVETPYQYLQSIRKTKMPTYVDNFKDDDGVTRELQV